MGILPCNGRLVGGNLDRSGRGGQDCCIVGCSSALLVVILVLVVVCLGSRGKSGFADAAAQPACL